MVADGEKSQLIATNLSCGIFQGEALCFGKISSAEGEIAKDEVGQETNFPGMC